MPIKKDEKGIGLIEVIAAFSISIVVITALVSLALYTMRSSLNSKLLLEGTKIASREIERVRALRDTSVSWPIFLSAVDGSSGPNCLNTNPCHMSETPFAAISGVSPVEMIDNQAVTRFFTITRDSNDPDNIVRVAVSVNWSVGGIEKNTHVYTDLTNWQPR